MTVLGSLRRQMLAMVVAFGVLICTVLLMAAVNVREHDARREIEARLRFGASVSARDIEKLLELGQGDFGAVLDNLVVVPELRVAAYLGPSEVVEQATDRRWIGRRLGDLPHAVPLALTEHPEPLDALLVQDDDSTQLWISMAVRQPPPAGSVRSADEGRLLILADTGGALRDAVWVAAVLTGVTVVLPVGLMICITGLWLRHRVADRIDALLQVSRAQVDGQATRTPAAGVFEGSDELAELGRELARLFGAVVASRDLERRLLGEMRQAHAALGEEQRRLRAVLDQAPVGIRHQDRQGRVLVNERLCEMLGVPAERLQRMSTSDFLQPEDQARRARRHEALVRGALAWDSDEVRLVRPDGASFWARLSVHTTADPEGGFSTVTVLEDIDARRRDEEQLRLLAACFDAAGDPILVAHPDGRVVAVNRALTALTGLGRDDFEGRPVWSVLSPGMPAATRGDIRRGLRRDGLWRGETMQIARDGRLHPVLLTVTVLRDGQGEPTHHIATAVDLSRIREAEERIRRLAYFDSLTGLPNRLSLRERGEWLLGLAARQQRPAALLFIDLDNFKEINDSLGHAAGDRMLCEVSARLLEQCRETDLLARLGGDEFVLLLPETDPDGARQLGERVLAALQPPVLLAGHALGVTASVGVSLAPQDGEDLDALMKNADTAMYQAKQAGRNALCFYDRRMNEATLDRLTLLSALRRAASNGELRTYFQPKVDLLTGRVTGAEALLRWVHPTMGMVPPGRFIPAAEQSDLIVTLDEWVLEDVCRQLQAWRRAGLPPLTVSVNVAALHFRKPTLVDDVLRTLARFDVPGTQIELEITEAALLEAGQERSAMMARLRERGLSLAIDDFGTGYSSLAYLKYLPISTLKIDRSFVRDLEHDVDDRVLVSTIVTLAHNLGLQVVAEGVENEVQRRHLIHSCCEQGQGWLYAQAMPADAFVAWWREQDGRPAASPSPWQQDWVSP